MVQWIFSFLFTAMENRGGIYFFDTFLKRKEQKGFLRHQFIIYFVVLYLMAVSDVWIGLLKCIPIILACTFLNLIYYHVSFRQSLIFSVINYAVMVLVDYVILCVCLIISPETGKMAVVGRDYLPALIAKTLWIIILMLIRKCSKSKQNYHLLTGTEFLQFLCIPVFTIICLLLMYCTQTVSQTIQGVFLFLSAGLVAVNFILMNLMQDILDKEEMLRLGILTEQNQKNRLDAYQDREEIYERQRRKMHDYKNQLATIQTLLKSQETEEALAFTQKLTESIAVDLSAINTNHPVINAVLNQKYRTMQEKKISVIFKVGDLHEVTLKEEEIVILLSNLLDNAIRESERVLKERGKAVVQMKLVYEDGKMIFAIKNPVMEKVTIINDMVETTHGENHGIGLRNVKAVVEKHEGEMVLSCDDNVFKAVVII